MASIMILYREATVEDVPGIERTRESDSEMGPADRRMARYMRFEHHPRSALMPRVVYVAHDETGIVGYIGGHLTRRYDCDGELQYLYVVPGHRRAGVASRLLSKLADWFCSRKARRICVDVLPSNDRAREFYARWGAVPLNSHWLVWPDLCESVADAQLTRRP